MNWIIDNDYLIGSSKNFKFDFKQTKKLALFDLDNTIIKTKSNKVFPCDYTDWIFNYDNTKKILHNYIDNDYCIIIISNQSQLKNNQTKINDWIKKINNIQKKLNIELKIFCSTSHNKYRKPLPSFYNEFIQIENKEHIFYCGDAGGRKNDFADTDLKFALNCMIKFKYPEEVFLNINNPDKTLSLKPLIPYVNFSINKIEHIIKQNDKEIVILVGYPASGKSYIAKKYHKLNYVIINQDTLKTKTKCIKIFNNALSNQSSIIIDNLNPDYETRKFWIQCAKKHNYKTKIIQMTTDINLSKHNNLYRMYKHNKKYIPNIVYNIYNKKYEKPSYKIDKVDIIEYVHFVFPNDYEYFYYMY